MAEKEPDAAAFWAWCKERATSRATMGLPEIRESFDTEMARIPLADNVAAQSLTFGSVPAEKITPANAAPGKALLYLHGGGHVFGSIKSHRHLVSRLAAAANVTAWHIDYRLAPEHPYPAAIEDALTAYRALLDSGIAPADLVVGGESAGGNLAAALVLKLKEENLPQPAGLYLLSPWLDMTTAASSYDKVGARDPMITREGIVGVAAAYLGGQDDNPLASPVRADVSGLPPMLIQVGSEEVLLSDSLTFAGKAALEGIDVTLRVWGGMPHAWPLFHPLLRAGLPAIEETGAWMRKRLGIG